MALQAHAKRNTIKTTPPRRKIVREELPNPTLVEIDSLSPPDVHTKSNYEVHWHNKTSEKIKIKVDGKAFGEPVFKIGPGECHVNNAQPHKKQTTYVATTSYDDGLDRTEKAPTIIIDP